MLRLSQKARRTVSRVIVGFFAVFLLVGAIGFGHVAAWYWLRTYLPGQFVALIFAGTDLLLAIILGVLASRSTPGMAEVEALAVRRRALANATETLTVSALVMRLVEQWTRSRSRR